MVPLTKEEFKLYQDARVCYVIFVEKKSHRLLEIKITEKSEIIIIIQVNIEAQHIVFVI